jgi:hypothetical protein
MNDVEYEYEVYSSRWNIDMFAVNDDPNEGKIIILYYLKTIGIKVI